MPKRSRETILVALLFAAIALFELRSLLFGGQTFYRADMAYNIEPVSTFVREYFKLHHSLPLWNPLVQGGVPQIAAAWPSFYPPAYIGLFFPFGIASGAFVAFHLLVCAAGGYLWQKANLSRDGQTGSFPFAALFFAFVCMLNGYMVGASINLSLMAAFSWTPLALYFLDRLIERPRVASCGAFSIVLSLQFAAGRPEIALLACLLYVFRIAMLAKSSQQIGKAIALCIGAVFLATAANAANFLPLFEILHYCPSATQFSVMKAVFWSAGWRDWLSALLPAPFGRFTMNTSDLDVTYAGVIPYITSIFVGPIPITLACLGLATWSRLAKFWLAFGIISFCASLGEFGPFSFLFQNQNLIRYPVKLSIFVVFSIACLAVLGWRAAFEDKSTGHARSNLFIELGWLLAALFSSAQLIYESCALRPEHGHGLLCIQLICASIIGVFVSIITRNKADASEKNLVLRQSALIFLTVVVLIGNWEFQISDVASSSIFTRSSNLAAWLKTRYGDDCKVLSVIDNDLVPPDAIADKRDSDLDIAFTSYCRSILRPNCNMDFNLALTNGVTVVPSWLSLFVDTGVLPRSGLTRAEHPLGKSDIPLYRFCQLTGTKIILTSATANFDKNCPSNSIDRRMFEPIDFDKAPSVRLYEVFQPMPRVSLIRKTRLVKDIREALKYINRADSNGFDPVREVLLCEKVPLLMDEAVSQHELDRRWTKESGNERHESNERNESNERESNLEQCTSFSAENDSIHIRAKLLTPAMLVMTDTYSNGWKATDNGKQTKVLLADGLIRAIPLSAGEHEVVLRFLPDSLTAGSLISICALLLLLAIVCGQRVLSVDDRLQHRLLTGKNS